MKRTVSIGMLCFLAFVPLGAQVPGSAPATPAAGTAPAATAPPAATASPGSPAPWIIGVGALEARGDSPELSYLAKSIPLRLLYGLSTIRTRTQGEDEIAAVRASARVKGLYEKGGEHARKMRELDELFFAIPGAEGEARRKGIKAGIDAARKKLEEAIDDADGIPVEPVRELKFWAGHAEGRLVEGSGGSPPGPAALCASFGLDALAGGSVEEIEGYLFVSLFLYVRSVDRVLYAVEEAAAPDDTEALVASFVERVRPLIQGRKAASLVVSASPVSATIALDGESAGSGFFASDSIDPGPHRIKVSAPGFRDYELDFSLVEGERLERRVALEKVDVLELELSSEPPGAKLFVDGMPAGEAPLGFASGLDPFILFAVLPGHETMHSPVFPAAGLKAVISLPELGLDRGKAIMKAQDAFYESFGYFTFSFAATGILYGLFYGYQQAFIAAGSPPGSELASVGMVFYVSFWGGAAVSGGLLGWTVYMLYEYIRSAS